MASIGRTIAIDRPAAAVWARLRDFAAVQSLFPGMLTRCETQGDERIVTFVDGTVVRERLLGLDDAGRRIAYGAVGGVSEHHNASFQVFDDGVDRCRVEWWTDILPDGFAQHVAQRMEAGLAALSTALTR